jgi:hypothetical protein
MPLHWASKVDIKEFRRLLSLYHLKKGVIEDHPTNDIEASQYDILY